MFTRIFKSNLALQFFILFLAAFILWVEAFLPQTPQTVYPKIISIIHFSPDWFSGMVWFSKLLALMLVLFEAIYLNLIISENGILPRSTFFVAFIYLILMSHSGNLLTFHPVLLSNLFLILSVRDFFKAFNKDDASTEIYSSVFWVGIASLFNLSAIFFLVFIWFSYITYRLLSWREWAISLFGIITPYLFLIVYNFWFDKPLLPDDYLYFFRHFRQIVFHPDTILIIFYVLLGLIFLISFPRAMSEVRDKVISIRKRFTILFNFLFAGIVSLIFSGENFEIQLCILFIPLSVYIAIFLTSVKKPLIPEILFIGLILSVLIERYLSFTF
ncbi:MAG TPA: hypothetical protein PKL64_04980 [Bacteroidales bacterium]|nr:hypothetical protein [Bacteroidales bacterium]